ncbi:hypothetical protein [Hydrotalea sandarakina]|jgi:hypothetical protein|uniref:Uncharacterized protein n=1 Tax=Hydrotalea sandarakina TaxID=1004304 RepID=A0A2W7RND2_9BACT|nr:hypothetical protein [Hydrotalea sandarakina]PZX62293.1 hypothetical protein LX80_01775 [Hydrotalea sandarakina]
MLQLYRYTIVHTAIESRALRVITHVFTQREGKGKVAAMKGAANTRCETKERPPVETNGDLNK